MASLVAVTLVSVERGGSVDAVLDWNVRSLPRIRHAAKPRQRITSRTVDVAHPNSEAQVSSAWRLQLFPKWPCGEGEDGDEYECVFAVESVAPPEGAPVVDGFSCRLDVTGTPHTAEAQAFVSDGGEVLRFPGLIPAASFAHMDTVTVRVTLRISERSVTSATALFGSVVAQLAGSRQASAAPVQAPSARTTSPVASNTSSDSAWHSLFGAVGLPAVVDTPPLWHTAGAVGAWAHLCRELSAAAALWTVLVSHFGSGPAAAAPLAELHHHPAAVGLAALACVAEPPAVLTEAAVVACPAIPATLAHLRVVDASPPAFYRCWLLVVGGLATVAPVPDSISAALQALLDACPRGPMTKAAAADIREVIKSLEKLIGPHGAALSTSTVERDLDCVATALHAAYTPATAASLSALEQRWREAADLEAQRQSDRRSAAAAVVDLPGFKNAPRCRKPFSSLDDTCTEAAAHLASAVAVLQELDDLRTL